MIQKLVAVSLAVSLCIANVQAQRSDEEQERKPFFKKENLFTGGSVGAGFGQGAFSLGLGPYFGYSLNKYVDVAASLNYNYVSQRDPFSIAKYRQSIIGPGAFVRLFPVKFLFAQAQYEYNFIQFKDIPGNNAPNFITKYNVQSFLIGGGYASGREGEGTPYFFFSVLIDIGKNPLSPYTDQYNRTQPIIRTGLHIPLFQGQEGGRRGAKEDW